MRNDPLAALPRDLVGRRLSLRVAFPDGTADRIGLVVAQDPTTVALEQRSGAVQVIERSLIQHARIAPTVPRGRNPRHAPADLLTALAHDPSLEAFPGPYWIARLCDLVDHLNDSGVRRPTATTAVRGDSRGMVNGEWAALRLATPGDLVPLAAWAARRDARNVVLTSGLPEDALLRLGLARLPG
jgi:hypothetical protein